MRQALALAGQSAQRSEVPVGALVVIDGEIAGPVPTLPSRTPTPPRTPRFSPSARPPPAWRNYRLTGATLYCTLEPCVMCAGALVAARVQRLVFGARDLRFGGVRSKFQVADSEVLNHRVEVVEGVLAVECVELLREFFEAQRRR